MQISSATSAVVTGGASGLGEATARMLAGAGAHVTLFDMNREAGAALAAELDGTYAQVDVSDAGSVIQAMADLRAAGRGLHVLVNCAGIAPAAKTVGRDGAHDPAMFAKTIGVNLVGSFFCASQGAALMAENDPQGADGERGVVINTASVAGYEGQIGQVAYAASKGGVIGMTLPMARDMAGIGIRVMSIAPGLFLTPMLAGLPQDVQDSLGRQAPYPARLGDPAEYAAMARQIIENPMLNGSVVRLDAALRMTPR